MVDMSPKGAEQQHFTFHSACPEKIIALKASTIIEISDKTIKTFDYSRRFVKIAN